MNAVVADGQSLTSCSKDDLLVRNHAVHSYAVDTNATDFAAPSTGDNLMFSWVDIPFGVA